MPAPVSKAGTNEKAWAMYPVATGASAPPRKPPKFWIAPSDPTRLAGAAAVASDHEQADAAFARKITTDMQTRAIVLLSASAAGMVKATMPSIVTTPRCDDPPPPTCCAG